MKIRYCIPKAAFLLILSLSIFLFINLACSQQNTTESHGITEKTEWIMIGDSYAAWPLSKPDKNWPDLLKKYLELEDSQVHIMKKRGFGIARTGKRYYSCFKQLDSSDTIKYILIQSGPANDRKMSKRDIRIETKRLAKLLKLKYPNAKVFYCCPNWNDKSKAKRQFLKARKKWYRSYARKNGWRYMNPLHHLYVGDHTWCVKDGHHPNVRGSRKLARAMYNILIKYM